MKKIFIILLIPIILFLTGCESHKDMNDLGIMSALGIRKDGNEYEVTAQLINIKKNNEQGNSNTSSVITYSEKGETIFEALRTITTESSKKLYFAHMKLLVLDKTILNDDPFEIVDFLAKDSESMLNFYVLVSMENTPKEILETITPFEEIPAEYIVKTLKTSEASYGNTHTMTFEDYLDDLVTNEIDPAYTKIKLLEDSEEKKTTEALKTTTSSNIKLGNILVFDKERKLVELTEKDSLSFNILSNKTSNAVITLSCENAHYTAEVMNNKTDIKFNEKTKKVTFNSNITLSIADYSCNRSLLNEKNTKEIKKQIKDYLENNNKTLLDKSLEYNSDFLGIGIFIKSNYKNFFDFKNRNWAKEGLPELTLESKVKVNLEKKGNLKDIVKKKEL